MLKIGDKRRIQSYNDANKTEPKACYPRLTFFVPRVFDMSSTFLFLCSDISWDKRGHQSVILAQSANATAFNIEFLARRQKYILYVRTLPSPNSRARRGSGGCSSAIETQRALFFAVGPPCWNFRIWFARKVLYGDRMNENRWKRRFAYKVGHRCEAQYLELALGPLAGEATMVCLQTRNRSR